MVDWKTRHSSKIQLPYSTMGVSLECSHDLESGYASGASSSSNLTTLTFTKSHLKHLNAQLSKLEPIDILRWAKLTLPNLYQTTAFGLSGLVTLDLLSKLQYEDPESPQIDLIFLDTLYHFQQTLDLVEKVKARYPNVNIHVYKPDGLETAAAFEAKYGNNLWESNPDLYDWVAKIEPAQRAYSELAVSTVLTGRRRSQGAKRSDLGVIEVDEAGLVKVNPMFNWSFEQVQEYVRANNVPYNELRDLGYKSVGDWHSTQPIAEGEEERAGRWKGSQKTECGIHNKRGKYAQFLMEQEMKAQQEKLSAALERSRLLHS
jgi:phosphoadenosine phosphosulfate reductase